MTHFPDTLPFASVIDPKFASSRNFASDWQQRLVCTGLQKNDLHILSEAYRHLLFGILLLTQILFLRPTFIVLGKLQCQW